LRKTKILRQLPGVKVHKSLRAALTAISEDLEKLHLVTVRAERKHRQAAAKGRAK